MIFQNSFLHLPIEKIRIFDFNYYCELCNKILLDSGGVLKYLEFCGEIRTCC